MGTMSHRLPGRDPALIHRPGVRLSGAGGRHDLGPASPVTHAAQASGCERQPCRGSRVWLAKRTRCCRTALHVGRGVALTGYQAGYQAGWAAARRASRAAQTRSWMAKKTICTRGSATPMVRAARQSWVMAKATVTATTKCMTP